jgi:hypothetical protein
MFAAVPHRGCLGRATGQIATYRIVISIQPHAHHQGFSLVVIGPIAALMIEEKPQSFR